jgi:hypothetical protein
VIAAAHRIVAGERVLIASCGMPEGARQAELIRRFPGLVPEELRRGVAIAQELLRAEAAEHFAEADALEAELRCRRRGAR